MERYSEVYSPTGGLAAEGVINQLGRPDIESLEVLVREAVQNCWDAKRSTYTYDVDSDIEVTAAEPFLFRYGYDFEHHTPLDPFRWQYLIVRREETAATRSMAQTAKVLAENPLLIRLKELEAYKELAGKVENLNVVLGSGAVPTLALNK